MLMPRDAARSTILAGVIESSEQGDRQVWI